MFKTLEKTVEYLYSQEIETDILAVPPEVDELTDENRLNNEKTTPLIITDISVHAEILVEPSEISYDDIPLINNLTKDVKQRSTMFGIKPNRLKSVDHHDWS